MTQYGRWNCPVCDKQFSTYDLRKGEWHRQFAHDWNLKAVWKYFNWWLSRFY